MMWGTLFMMGGAYALAQDAHVRVDVIYRRWRPTRKQQLNSYASALLLPCRPGPPSLQDGSSPISRCGVMNPANVPMFHFMMIIPAAGAILFLQGLAQVARCIACLRTGEWPPVLVDVEETEGIFR
jgi:TRAP-type mannitol/chloroaromatic compound transport system permease small subunit